jgi:hypothetical protein
LGLGHIGFNNLRVLGTTDWVTGSIWFGVMQSTS